jgi:hypothetical protein
MVSMQNLTQEIDLDSEINKWGITCESNFHFHNDAVPYQTITCTLVVSHTPNVIADLTGLITIE